MKKLLYLFTFAIILGITSCGGGEAAVEETSVDTVACADDCQKACCLGCKATEGDAKCIVLEDGSMPCCIIEATETTCCCGDSTCDGSCHLDPDSSQEPHSHEGESHDHTH